MFKCFLASGKSPLVVMDDVDVKEATKHATRIIANVANM